LKPEVANPYLTTVGSTSIADSKHLSDLVSRPEVHLADVLSLPTSSSFVPRGTFSDEVIESVELSLKYEGYIAREKQQADKNNRLEYVKIPADFDFSSLNGLSMECRQKLNRYRPSSIADASRISGVSPADIAVLLVYFGR
jgi:NAD/FAD-utilizing enzyme apparently involved in cell division